MCPECQSELVKPQRLFTFSWTHSENASDPARIKIIVAELFQLLSARGAADCNLGRPCFR